MTEPKRTKDGCFTCRIRRKKCTRSNNKPGDPCDDCSRLQLECLESEGANRPKWLAEKDYRKRAALDAIAVWNSDPRSKPRKELLNLTRFASPIPIIEQEGYVKNWPPEYDHTASFPSSTTRFPCEPETYRGGAQTSISSQLHSENFIVPPGLLPLRYPHIADSGHSLHGDDVGVYAEEYSSSATHPSGPFDSSGLSYASIPGYNTYEPHNTFEHRNSYDPYNKYEPHTTYEHRGTREPRSTYCPPPVGPLFQNDPPHQEAVHNWNSVPSAPYPNLPYNLCQSLL